jgi:putative phosphotransacetylase
LDGTPGLKLIGPVGEVDLDHGAIVAFRHVHLSPSQAKEAGVVDKQIVSIRTDGERGLVFDNVMVRTGEGHEAEVHFDTDEGNAAGLCNGDLVEILI